jgi:uncharacterized protein
MGVDALRRSRTALLTSYRRNGQQVATPVSISLAGGRAYFVTAVDSGKARRLAHDPRVLLAPCTVGGERLGADVSGRARRLQGGARRARPMLVRPTGPLFLSWLLYRLRGKTMAGRRRAGGQSASSIRAATVLRRTCKVTRRKSRGSAVTYRHRE